MLKQKYFRTMDDSAYARWIRYFDILDNDQLRLLARELNALSAPPKIAIVPLAVRLPSALSTFARELNDQLYSNWYVYSGDDVDRSGPPGVDLSKAAETADFVLPLPVDVVLSRDALAQFAVALTQAPDAVILYGDEDLLQNGRRSRPHFKTDWDPFLILGRNYVGVPTLYRSEALKRAKVEELTSSGADNLLHALTLRVAKTAAPENIVHIPAVLCHRRGASDWDAAEGRRVVATHLTEMEIAPADVHPARHAPQWNHIRFPLPDPAPLASIIVPTRDRADLIGRCCDGILNHTDYPSIELIIVDNGTVEPDALAILDSLRNDPRVRILRDDRPFNFSQLNNCAAKEAKGEILVLLNNDIEIIDRGWLRELASLACRPEIGAVGAKLLYPDLRVQHAGVTFGPDNAVSHQMRLAERCETGPYGELALLRSVSAVTAACLALRKTVYLELGGLNEEEFAVAYNDIDLCRRIAKNGLVIVCTPFAELLHHESLSRGLSVTPEKLDREASELIAFWHKHPELFEFPDPFHNPQIEFKWECVDFAWPPRSHRFRCKLTQQQPLPFLY